MQRKNNTQAWSNKAKKHTKKIQYFVPTEPRNQNKAPFFFIHATLQMVTEKRAQNNQHATSYKIEQ